MAEPSVPEYIEKVLEINEDGNRPYVINVAPSNLTNYRTAKDTVQRKVYVSADIFPHNLQTQNNPTPSKQIIEWIKGDGYVCDRPGFIIPAEFGGSAEPNNIIPQSILMDTTAFDSDKEKVREFLLEERPNRYAKVKFAFGYTFNGDKFYRPIRIYYHFLLHENGAVVEEMSNKLVNRGPYGR